MVQKSLCDSNLYEKRLLVIFIEEIHCQGLAATCNSIENVLIMNSCLGFALLFF